MRITDDYRGVGIGVVSPAQKLEVDGNIKVNDKILGEGDSWSLAQQFSAAARQVKATEAPSLSIGDASPNDHEGASPLVICCQPKEHDFASWC